MSELEGLQKKIQDEKLQLQEARDREKKVVSELNRIEKDLAEKRKSLRQYDVQLREKEKEIKKLSENIETLQKTLAEQEAQLGHYGQVLYKLSRTDLFKAAFSAQSFPELMRRHEYLTRIIDYNADVIDQYARNIERIEQDRERLRVNENRLASLATKARSTQKLVLQHKGEKRTLLAKVTSEKDLHLIAIEELEEASRQLQALIEKLGESTSVSTVSRPKLFSACKSRFIFPVDGDIISYFGEHEDKEFSTISLNNGIEIRSAMGKPIRAVFDGSVIYADWFKGYGNLLIIDHGEGYYTLSGHASELIKNVGDQVQEGETIGYVGDAGSLRGPNLYFEIRHHGKPVDPLEWLESRQ
jgi:septal ring factor EnvC (AmiA/AmiB activator)